MSENKNDKCPICLGAEGGTCQKITPQRPDREDFKCDVCRQFSVSDEVLEIYLWPGREKSLDSEQRAMLSRHLRTRSSDEIPTITETTLRLFFQSRDVFLD